MVQHVTGTCHIIQFNPYPDQFLAEEFLPFVIGASNCPQNFATKIEPLKLFT